MKKRIMAILLASNIMAGCVPVMAYADSIGSNYTIETAAYKSGVYEVNNCILKIDADTDSAARKYVNETSEVVINKDGTTATVVFNNRSIMSNIKVKVNGEEVVNTQVEEGDNNLKVTFNLSDINDSIEMSSDINLGFMKMNVSFRVLLDTKDIPEEEIKVETPEAGTSDNTYKTGSYEVTHSVLKIDSDETSSAGRYIDSNSLVEINEESVTVTLTFLQRSIMSNIKINMNGEEIETIQTQEGDTNLKVSFKVKSLNEPIEVSSTINAGFHVMDVSFRVLLDTASIPKNDGTIETPGIKPEVNPEVKPVQPVEPPKIETVTPEVTPIEPPKAEESQSYSIYKINNEILTNSAIGYSAARAAINSLSYIEVIDGVTYVTVGVSQLDVMTNIRVAVNGNSTNYEILRSSSNNNTMDIRFKINSLKDTITISSYITMSGMDISFGLDLLESSMVLISKTEAQAPLAQKTETTVTNTNIETLKENDIEVEAEEIEAKSYFKKYTINNEVIYDSETGKKMVRKYLEEQCILEEIDGNKYLTIKMSSMNAMSNVRITVNGQDVDFKVIDVTDGISSIRFKINDVNDNIQMYMTISIIGKDINFGINLLENSMVLVEESTITQDEKDNIESEIESSEVTNIETASKSPNIIKIAGVSSAVTAGVIFAVEGIIYGIIKRRKRNQSDK